MKFILIGRFTLSGQTTKSIDKHDSGYLGMAVQLYVQARSGHYHAHLSEDCGRSWYNWLLPVTVLYQLSVHAWLDRF